MLDSSVHILQKDLLFDGYGVVVVDYLLNGLESNLTSIMDSIEFIKCAIADFDHS